MSTSRRPKGGAVTSARVVAGKAAPRGRYPHVKVVGEVNDFAGYNEVYGE